MITKINSSWSDFYSVQYIEHHVVRKITAIIIVILIPVLTNYKLLGFIEIQLSAEPLWGYFSGHFKTFLNETEGSWLCR